MKSQAHIGFWLLLFAVSLLVIPLFVSADSMYQRLVVEFLAVREVFGETVGGWIVDATNSVHGLLVSTGLQDVMVGAVHNEEDRRAAERYFSGVGKLVADAGSSYITSLMMQIYSAIMRIFIVLTWMLLLLPFLGAAIIDGINQRSVKFATFGYQNPTAFSLGSHLVILIGALPFMYVVVPMMVTPLFMPMWALLTAIPLAFATSHMQPIFTR